MQASNWSDDDTIADEILALKDIKLTFSVTSKFLLHVEKSGCGTDGGKGNEEIGEEAIVVAAEAGVEVIKE